MLPLVDTKGLKYFSFWVIVIILLNAFIFYLELASPNPDTIITRFALIPSMISLYNLSSLTPFITSQFLHGSFLHIISNMLFLWVFGRNIEARFGSAFPIFYLFSGVAGGVAQYLVAPSSAIPTMGASGAIAGVLGAYFAFFPNNRIKTLVFIFIFVTIIDIPAWIMLFYWFVTQIISTAAIGTASLSQGGIAYTAHIAGFLTGFVIAKFFYPRPLLRLA